MIKARVWSLASCLAAALVLQARGAAAQNKPDEKEWIQLFNGKTLDGWLPKITGYELGNNYLDTFRVENGVMKVSYDRWQKFDAKFGHIFYNRKFSHYVLAVEYRFVGEQVAGGPSWALRNSGAMLHCQAPETMGKDQDFPICIEAQFLGGNGTAERTTANLCTPGSHVVMNGQLETRHCIQSTSKTYHGDQWVRVELEVLGDTSIRHMIDGKAVLAYEKPQIGGPNVANFDPAVKRDGAPMTEGYISLQAESHPVEFRKVELLELAGCTDPKAKNYKTYFVKSDNSRCRY